MPHLWRDLKKKGGTTLINGFYVQSTSVDMQLNSRQGKLFIMSPHKIRPSLADSRVSHTGINLVRATIEG